jgi:hypothetical protein
MMKKRVDRLDILDEGIFRNRFEMLSSFAKDFYRRNSLEFTLHPDIIDLCYFPEVRQLMSRDLTVVVTKEDISGEIESIFPDLLARWREGIDAELVALVTAQLGLSNDVRPLELAALLFKCRSCTAIRTYPAVLSHRCLYSSYYLHDQERPLSYDMRPMSIFHRRPWSCSNLDLDFCAQRIGNMINACGGDYKTTTCEELDQLDPRLSCTLCRVNPGRKIIMTWRTAVTYSLTHSTRCEPLKTIHL